MLKTFELPDDIIKQHERDAVYHASGFVLCTVRIEQWMRKNARDEVCLLVVEDNENSRNLIRHAHRHLQNPAGFEQADHRMKELLPLTTIKHDPLFEPKKKSSVLQVADFCAYVMKRTLMNPGDQRYLPYYRPLHGQVFSYPDV